MVGEVEEEPKRITIDLSEIEVWKLERIRDNLNRNGDPEDGDLTLEDVVRDLLGDAIIERARSLS